MEVQHWKVFLDQPLELLGIILSVCCNPETWGNLPGTDGGSARWHSKLEFTHHPKLQSGHFGQEVPPKIIGVH